MMNIGDKFKSETKVNTTNFYELAGVNPKGYYILKAIDQTLEELKHDLDTLKKNNPSCEGVQNVKIENFAVLEVEGEWFNQRKITVLQEA